MSSLTHITAAILAGGLGTRLRSVVPDKPKVLAEVGGRPFVFYLLDQLAHAGVKNVVLCIGYKGEMVQAELGSSYRGMALHYSTESSPLGTGGALREALPALDSKTILVMNGDSYCDARLGDFAAWHVERQSSASLLLSETDDTRRYGRVDLNEHSGIVRFREKADTTGPGWVNAGLYLLEHDAIESIPSERGVSLEKELFPAWVNHGLHGYRSEGRLWDIGVPDAYAEALKDFTKGLTSGSQVRAENHASQD